MKNNEVQKCCPKYYTSVVLYLTMYFTYLSGVKFVINFVTTYSLITILLIKATLKGDFFFLLSRLSLRARSCAIDFQFFI